MRSTASATASPPARQIEATPRAASCRRIACSRGVRMRAPLAPIPVPHAPPPPPNLAPPAGGGAGGHGAAVTVPAVESQAEIAAHPDDHRGECLVDLDEVHVILRP